MTSAVQKKQWSLSRIGGGNKMNSDSYILKKGVLSRFQRQKNDTCAFCGKKLKIGDRVVSRNNTSRRYHKNCFDSLFMGGND